MAKIIPMKVADVRAAFARKFDEMRARNWKRSKNERKPAPEPANYPFWLRVVVVIALALLAVNVFFFLGPATAFIAWVADRASISGKEMIAGLGTLVASFAGAWFAFRFARIQRDKERISNEVAAGNRALFILSEIWNAQRQHQIEIVEPYRGKSDSWLNLHVSQPFDEHHATFDVEDLSFLLPGNAAEFQRLFLEARRYRMAAHLVKEHNRLVLTQVFPLLSAAGIKKEPRSTKEVEGVLGTGIVRQLTVLTASIITNVDENVKSSLEAFKMLRSALKSIYPSCKFIDLKSEA